MILEIADIRIQPGQQAAFDEAIQRGQNTVISRAQGFKGWKVRVYRAVLNAIQRHWTAERYIRVTDDDEGEASYQELYEFVRLIPVSLSIGRNKVSVADSSLLKYFERKKKPMAEAQNVVEMFTPHRPS